MELNPLSPGSRSKPKAGKVIAPGRGAISDLPTKEVRRRRFAATGVILLCLGFQVLVVSRLFDPPRLYESLAALRLAPAPSLWPFLDYRMFSEAHYAGERVLRACTVLEWEDGEEERLYPEQGHKYFDTQAMLEACKASNGERIAELICAGEQARGMRVRQIRTEQFWLELGEGGFRAEALESIPVSVGPRTPLVP